MLVSFVCRLFSSNALAVSVISVKVKSLFFRLVHCDHWVKSVTYFQSWNVLVVCIDCLLIGEKKLKLLTKKCLASFFFQWLQHCWVCTLWQHYIQSIIYCTRHFRLVIKAIQCLQSEMFKPKTSCSYGWTILSNGNHSPWFSWHGKFGKSGFFTETLRVAAISLYKCLWDMYWFAEIAVQYQPTSDILVSAFVFCDMHWCQNFFKARKMLGLVGLC